MYTVYCYDDKNINYQVFVKEKYPVISRSDI